MRVYLSIENVVYLFICGVYQKNKHIEYTEITHLRVRVM